MKTKQYIYTFKNGETSFTVDCQSKEQAKVSFKRHYEKFAGMEKIKISKVSILK